MDKALRYLSLAMKAGRVSVGLNDCEELLRRRKCKIVIIASDAGDSTVKNILSLTGRSGVSAVRVPYTKMQLASPVGRSTEVAVAAISDAGLAKAFSEAIEIGKQQEEHII